MLTSSAEVVRAYQFPYAAALTYTAGGRFTTAHISVTRALVAGSQTDVWTATFSVVEELQGGRFHRSEEQRGSPDREEVAAWLMTKVCPWENLL